MAQATKLLFAFALATPPTLSRKTCGKQCLGPVSTSLQPKPDSLEVIPQQNKSGDG